MTMNRREFAAAGAALLGAPLAAWAQKPPQDGTDYRTLERRVPVEAPEGKIEVIEFFWYSCPHCYRFEPKLVSWSKRQPPDVVLRRVPAAFRDDMVPQQRLFYTLEAMGVLDEMHPKVYESIHFSNEPTHSGPGFLAFAQKNGLDIPKFTELYQSMGVSAKARRAVQLQQAYRVEGVPAMGVAGRWLTDGDMAGSVDRALLVTDFLVGEARKAK